IIFPSLVSKLTGSGNRVKRPQLPASPDIERPDLPFCIVVGCYGHSLFHRHPDDNNFLHHGWSRVETGVTLFQIDLLSGAVDDPNLEVDYSVFSECGDSSAGLGIETNETIGGGHIDYPRIAFAIGPI